MRGSLNRYLQWGVAAIIGVLLLLVVATPTTRNAFFSGSGIAQGALIAAIALGVVLTYRGSGVVNFAQATIAMYVAYVYAVLRRDGDLFLPPIPNPLSLIEGIVNSLGNREGEEALDLWDIPTRISFGPNMQFWPALIISLVFAVFLGLALHFLVFRPLRHAPPLAKVVASIGLFLFMQAVAIRRFTIQPYNVPEMPFFDANAKPIDLPFGISLRAEEIAIALLVIFFTVVLWAVFQMTRFGLATRAASENEKGAVVLGFSPDFLAGANWVISTVITGLLGIFAATIQGSVDPSTLPTLIVPALTAALVGGFTSFGITTAAAFGLGMLYPLIKTLEAQYDWYPSTGGTPMPGGEFVVPLVVIVLVLYLRGNSLPTRGAITTGRLPFSPTPPTWAIRYGGPALALVTAFLALFVFDPVYRIALSNTLIGIIICLSLVVLTGYVGQISLAQMAFAGISAFLVSKLTTEAPLKVPLPFSTKELTVLPEMPFPLPIIVGALVAMVVGMVVALPALRVRGVNLAIVTLAFAVAVDKAVFANKSVNGGFAGAKVEAPNMILEPRDVKFNILGFTAGDGLQPNPMTPIFILVVVVIVAYAVANLRRSATGRRMLATRSNERAAAAAGVSVSGTKVLAFAISSFIAGVGGAVIAYRSGSVTVDKFDFYKSLTFLAFAYIGGIASVYGAISGGFLVAGGLLFTFMDDYLGIPAEFTLILGGLGLIISAIQYPEGVSGAARHIGLAINARRQRTSAPTSEGGT